MRAPNENGFHGRECEREKNNFFPQNYYTYAFEWRRLASQQQLLFLTASHYHSIYGRVYGVRTPSWMALKRLENYERQPKIAPKMCGEGGRERERECVHCSRHIIVNDEFFVPNVCTQFYSWKHDITYDTRWVAVVGTQAFEIELNVSQKWTMLREREKKKVVSSVCVCVWELAETAHRVRHNSYTKRKCWWCEFRLACGVPCSDIYFGSTFTFIYTLASKQFNIPFISHPKIHICTAMVGQVKKKRPKFTDGKKKRKRKLNQTMRSISHDRSRSGCVDCCTKYIHIAFGSTLHIWCNSRLTTRSSVKSNELAIPHAAIQTIILVRCFPVPELLIITQRGMWPSYHTQAIFVMKSHIQRLFDAMQPLAYPCPLASSVVGADIV